MEIFNPPNVKPKQPPGRILRHSVEYRIMVARKVIEEKMTYRDAAKTLVGWAISRDLSHKFCLQSLEIAVQKYKPPPGIIHHSDRGVQYACIDYVAYLEKNNFKISQSRLATPEDNAFIESFFKTLKKEEVYFKNYKTMNDVINNLPKFIDEVYKTKRLHASLGYKTPAEFEEEVLKLKPANRPVQKLWGWSV